MTVYKSFRHIGDRSPETDKLAEKLAAHAITDAHPGITDLRFDWVKYDQPDMWLLFVSGETEDQ